VGAKSSVNVTSGHVTELGLGLGLELGLVDTIIIKLGFM
jgi:hypothetical protein